MRAEGAITAPPPLIVGVGNRDRGDDAAGPMVVDRLRTMVGEQALHTRIVEGDLSGLVLEWGPNQDVIIVDAMLSDQAPGHRHERNVLVEGLPTSELILSSHGIGVADTVELARMLNLLPRSLVVIGIEAAGFDHRAPLSAPVAAAVDALCTELSMRLQSHIGLPPGGSRDRTGRNVSLPHGPNHCRKAQIIAARPKSLPHGPNHCRMVRFIAAWPKASRHIQSL